MIMVKCQNCGNVNSPESHYCRQCGMAFIARQADSPSYDREPPRPYSLKTDEFQTQSEARRPAVPTQGLYQNPHAGPLERGNRTNQYIAPQMFPGTYRCPRCMSQLMPMIERRISTGGWITFAILLIFFFPLFWIGLLIKEDVHVCPSCNTVIK